MMALARRRLCLYFRLSRGGYPWIFNILLHCNFLSFNFRSLCDLPFQIIAVQFSFLGDVSGVVHFLDNRCQGLLNLEPKAILEVTLVGKFLSFMLEK